MPENITGHFPSLGPQPAPTQPPAHTPSAYPPPAGYMPPQAYYPPSAFPPPAPPQPHSFTPPPRRPGLSKKAISWIVAGAILIVLALMGGIVALIFFIAGAVKEREMGAPLVTGKEATPQAREPLECSNRCLSSGLSLMFSSDFSPYGLNTKPTEAYATSVSAEHDALKSLYADVEGTPASCAVTYATSAVTLDISEDSNIDAESIQISESFADADEINYLQQSTREFANSAEAESYMQRIDTELDACTTYSSTFEDYTTTTSVTRAPALERPDSIAAVGWVEASAGNRFYAIDLQRGNVVVRTTLNTYEGMTEQEFRDIVTLTAQRLAASQAVAQ